MPKCRFYADLSENIPFSFPQRCKPIALAEHGADIIEQCAVACAAPFVQSGCMITEMISSDNNVFFDRDATHG